VATRVLTTELGAEPAEFTDVQTRHIGMSKQGSYKADQYPY